MEAKSKNIRTDKIKGLLKARQKQYKDAASKIGINEKSFTNKMVKGNITVAELISIADTVDSYIAFVDKGNNEIIEKFKTEDIKAADNNKE